MEDPEVDKILKFTDTQEDLDGNIKYEGETDIFLKLDTRKCTILY